MAVTTTMLRGVSSFNSKEFDSNITLGMTGTYVTGGFTWTPAYAAGTPGSSPLPVGRSVATFFSSPLGYLYPTTFNGKVATTKIMSAPNTEIASGAAVPEPSVLVRFVGTKFV